MPVRKPQKPWKTPEDLKSLALTDRRIGGEVMGDVFVGRAAFADGSRHRVAVKRFKRKLSDRVAKIYQEAISDLREAGVPLPKMGMVKWKGEWHQVSQLFGSTMRGSKIHVALAARRLKQAEGKKEFADIMAATINAGYLPTLDYLTSFMKGSLIPIDLDAVIQHRVHGEELSPALLSRALNGFPFVFNLLPEADRIEILDAVWEKIKDPKFKGAVAQFKYLLFGLKK